MPGTIWYVGETGLARIPGGPIAADVFPSAFALPDGRLVAIASKGDGSADAEQLALVGRDGRIERIGPAAASVRDPAVDPGGRWIAVAMTLDGHSDLYRIALDGKTTRLTDEPAGNFAPAALADGDLAFVSSRDGDAEIYRMSAPVAGRRGTAELRRLTAFHRDDWAPLPSPDGKTLAFSSDREGAVRIFTMALDGSDQRRLTTRDTGDELEPAWSRDGKQLAYVVEQRGARTVIVRDLATGTERALTPPGARDYEPTFSPDGTWLAVSRDGAIVAIELATGTSRHVAAGRLPRWGT